MEGPLACPPQGRALSRICSEGGGSAVLGVARLPQPHTDQRSILIPAVGDVPHAWGSGDAPALARGGDVPFTGTSHASAWCSSACEQEQVLAPQLMGRLPWHRSPGRAPASRGTRHPPGKCTRPGDCTNFSCSVPAALPQHWRTIPFFQMSMQKKKWISIVFAKYMPQGSRQKLAYKHLTIP